MNNLRPFQIVILAAFGFLAVIAVIFLTLFQAERSQEELAYGERVLIWGTLSSSAFNEMFQEIQHNDKAFNVVEYRQMSEDTFGENLVDAIAEDRSPDLIVLRSDSLVDQRVKLLPIPYETIKERDFRDTYADGADFFALEDGIYGIPFAIDPMVMYWNRDMFSSNGLASAPTSWEEIVGTVIPALTARDMSRNVLKSAVSFGEYRNVAHGKNILMLLLLQSGSQMVLQEGKRYLVNLNEPILSGSRAPLEAAVQFYTDFSNVNSPLYSWNRAMPTDKNVFLAGDLGLYFGLGSEYSDIGEKNPNLNFDIAPVPQGANATALRTSADIYAFAIPRASKNVQGAFGVANVLGSEQYVDGLVKKLHMSPARRALIAKGDSNLYREVILQSALIARAWLDPQPKESDAILMQMIEDVVSNRERINDAVNDAVDRLILVY